MIIDEGEINFHYIWAIVILAFSYSIEPLHSA